MCLTTHDYNQERIRTVARVRACDYIKFETGWNLPPLLKIVTCRAHAALTFMHCCEART